MSRCKAARKRANPIKRRLCTTHQAKEMYNMSQKFKKMTNLFITVLCSLLLCLQPVNQAEKPTESGISICNSEDEEVILLPLPQPPKPH